MIRYYLGDNMELKFITNDYVLIWNLVYQPSHSKELNSLKNKLWNNYKDEYIDTYNEKNMIFSDYKNFIPTNDTIYNIVLEREEFNEKRKEIEKYRKRLLSTWDQNKNKINDYLRKTIKINIIPYEIFLVSKELNIVDMTINNNKTRGILVIGKDEENELNILLNIILFILRKELEVKEKELVSRAVIELLVLCELQTRLTKKSTYFNGSESLEELKKKIYPYWLMYLGINKDNFVEYMQRDKIAFNINEYEYDKNLSRMNIKEFINYIYKKVK